MSRANPRLACLLLSLVTGAFAAPAPAAVLPWFDGSITSPIGQDLPCPPAAQNLETRVAGYSGYTYYPPYQPALIPFAQFPAVGEIFYTKLVLSHPGNPCFGSAVGIEVLLPAGVSPAISAANPLFCFARVPPNSAHGYLLYDLANDAGYGCPQSLSQGIEGLALRAPNNSAGGGAWGMFQGAYLEFLVPLTSSVAQNGSNQIYFRVNPDIAVVGYTNVPLVVNADTVFRAPFEDQSLTLDLCSLTPVAQGC